MTPQSIAENIADVYELEAAERVNVSPVHRTGGENDPAVFYVDVLNPVDGNQRFTVTVTESPDIQT